MTSIPLPPRDPAVTALHTALSGDAMSELVSRRLPECAAGTLVLQSCRPRYIRYKPGTSCLVEYELAFRLLEGSSLVTSAHAWLFADRHAERIWSGRSLHRLVERAEHRPDPPETRAALLPELKALLEVFPVDRKLPALVRATSPGKMRRDLREALGEHAFSGEHKPRIELVRYKPARKALLRYGIRGGQLATVYGKLYADTRGARLFEVARALASAGAPVPTALAHLPKLRLLVLAEAHGDRLADLRPGDPSAFEDWLGAVAAAVATLHGVEIEGLQQFRSRNGAGATLEAGPTIAALVPTLGSRVVRLAENVAAELEQIEPTIGPIHGDFYDDQVLVSSRGVVLLDFDRARLGHPLIDVGNFLAHLSERGSDAGREVFMDAYETQRPGARPTAALFEAAALLQLAVAPFRRLDPAWPEEVERIVELAAKRLEEYRGRGSNSAYPADPTLPQLDRLLNRDLIGRELEPLLEAEQVRVTEATVVRHKPGKRCLVRYDVEVGLNGAARGERLYGKAFATGRGAHVFTKLQAVALARACGPDVQIPEPIGYLPAHRLLLQRTVEGEPIAPALVDGDLTLAGRIADALHSLHVSDLQLERRHGLDDELDPLATRVEALGAGCPRLQPLTERCLALVEHAREQTWPWRLRPVHRDFYYDQVLVTETELAVLDFDDAKMSEPAIDVANFLAHLRLLALKETGAPGGLTDVAAAFLERYRSLDDELPSALLRLLEGTTLLRLAAIHLPRARGEWLAERLLGESERLLAEADLRSAAR